MRRKRTLLLIVAGMAAGAALVALLRRDPAPPPSIFDEVSRLAVPAEVPRESASRPETPDVPVAVEGPTLKAGALEVDLTRASEELARLVLRFRGVHAEFRTRRADPELRKSLAEAGTALGHLLERHPDLGLPFFRAALEEPHRDAIRDLAPILLRARSPALHDECLRVLDAGGGVMPQYLAAVGLSRSADPRTPLALGRAWERESDSLLRAKLVESLIATLSARPPEDPPRLQALERFRERARSETDPARRIESVGVLVEGQAGRLPETDRTLVLSLLDAEKDPRRKGQLDQLARRIRP